MEGLFMEGGDEPQHGVQVQPWGPESIDARMLGLLTKYDHPDTSMTIARSALRPLPTGPLKSREIKQLDPFISRSMCGA